MKTKNMRKKALLSSVAMLLVAVIALTGATYAWWTTNNSVDLTSIQFKTENQSSLRIAEGSINSTSAPSGENAFAGSLAATWGSGNTYFTPVSTTFGKGSGTGLSWYTVTPATQTEAVNYDNQKVASIQTTNSPSVIHERIWFTNDAACSVCVSSIDWGDAVGTKDITSCLRIGIVNSSSAKFFYAPDDISGTATSRKYAIDSATYSASTCEVIYDDLYKGVTSKEIESVATNTGVTYVDMSTKKATVGASGTEICSFGAGGFAYVDIYIWLEGNDGQCTNTNAGGQVEDIALTFSVYVEP